MLVTGVYVSPIHPVPGIDHLLAMISIDNVSVILGNRAIWAIPVAFVAAIAAGYWFRLRGALLPHSEACITASPIILGFTIAIGERVHGTRKVAPL